MFQVFPPAAKTFWNVGRWTERARHDMEQLFQWPMISHGIDSLGQSEEGRLTIFVVVWDQFVIHKTSFPAATEAGLLPRTNF